MAAERGEKEGISDGRSGLRARVGWTIEGFDAREKEGTGFAAGRARDEFVAFYAPRENFGGDSRVDRDERARAHAPNTALRKYQPKMYDAMRSVLPESLDSASAALTTALATTPRLTAGARDARIAPAEKPAERPTAPVERKEAPPSLGAGAVEAPPTAQHRGAASTGAHEDLPDAVLARGTARRAETAPTAAMITVPTSVRVPCARRSAPACRSGSDQIQR